MQIALTLAAFGYLLSITDLGALAGAFRQGAALRLPAGLLALSFVMLAGTLRWRWLLHAYGAAHRPPLARLFRLQLVGLFYNMLPGAVGGDVLRAVLTRDAFGEKGLGAGLAVVFVERILGLLGLILLVTTTLALHPVRGLSLSTLVLALGLAGSCGAIGAIATGRRLARVLPRRLGIIAAQLPELRSPASLWIALALSITNQALIGVMGHLLISQGAPAVSLADSLVLSPLAFAAIFFPLTVAGAGTRDAAMIALYGLLGVPRAHALASSLQVLLCYLVLSGIGGLLALGTPLTATPGGDDRAA